MSELPITPFAAVPGLQAFGDDAAGFCADGTCEVPVGTAPADDAPSPAAQATDHPA